jgi:hypothetical protein
MTTEHPITPPPELVKQWVADDTTSISEDLIRAAQWGADMELEACCEWLVQDWTDIETADKLRAARRPKPTSLKEQALECVELFEMHGEFPKGGFDTIRRAIEALPND